MQKVINKFFTASLIFASFGIINIQAQETLSLKQCFELAEKNNINYQQLKLSQDNANLDLKQSKDNFLPSVNSNINYAFNLGRSINPTSNTFVTQGINTLGFGVNAGLALFQGFIRSNQVESNKLALKSTQLDAASFFQTLQLSIFSAYLEILKAEEQVEVLKEQNRLNELQKTQTEKLIKAGVVPKSEIYNIEAQLSGNNSQITIAQNLIELAYLNLRQLIEYQDDNFDIEKVALPTLIDELQLSTVENIYQQAVGKRPEIEAGEIRLNIAQYAQKIADGAKYPTLSFFTGLNTNYASFKIPNNFELGESDQLTPYYAYDANGIPNPIYTVEVIPTDFRKTPFFTQFSENISWNFGLALSIPIFNQFRVKNGVERTKIGIRNQELSNKQLKNDLLKTIQQAHNTAKSNYLNYQASLANITALEKNLAIIEKRYEYGTATALELNTASNTLTVAKLSLNNLKYDYIFSIKILDFYAGKELNLE